MMVLSGGRRVPGVARMADASRIHASGADTSRSDATRIQKVLLVTVRVHDTSRSDASRHSNTAWRRSDTRRIHLHRSLKQLMFQWIFVETD